MNNTIVGSVGGPGDQDDYPNNRYRGLVPHFLESTQSLQNEWQQFVARGARVMPGAGRLSLRAVVNSEAIANPALQGLVEAYLPLTSEAGMAYIARNTADRQVQLSPQNMNTYVDGIARAISGRFRSPVDRLTELHRQGYRFTSTIPDETELHELWGPTFGWSPEQVHNLSNILTDQAQRDPAEHTTWFTGVQHNNRLVGAVLAERLDVRGPLGAIPIIESTEWRIDESFRHSGVAAGLLAVNTAQCLRDRPDARIYAECRYSSTAFAAGMSVGFSVPSREHCPQILARNVWVDNELADFIPVVLAHQAVSEHYSPQARAAILDMLNQPNENGA